MNLSADLIIPILETHSELAREKYRKWIISFYPKNLEWTVTDMKDTIAIFQSMDYREDIYEEELTVYDESSSILLSVSGISNISSYCQYENPTAAKGKWFRYTIIEDVNTTQLPDIFSLKILSKIEEKKETEEATPQGWELSMKKYNITKRIVYTDTKTGVKYNMCITRNTDTLTTNMIASGVSSRPITIEYNIECPPELDTKDTMVSIVRMLQVIEQNRSPITIDQQKQVLQEYDSLIDKIREKKHFRESYYLAPKPLTLEQVHLSEAGLTYGQLSILDGYAVTDKADGERMLMYVNNNGESYLINSAFEVRGTGVRAKRDVMYNTLLDGEYLPASKRLDGVERDMFAVFDVYFVGGESVMGLPLINTGKFVVEEKEITHEKAKTKNTTTATKAAATTGSSYKISGKSRVDIMNSVLVNNLWEHDRDTSLEVVAKKHIAAKGMDMFAACRKILNDATKNGAPYDIDGLIFTPTDLPVLGYYPNKPITIKSASATWDRVLKWKPPEQNSVDFCISIDKNPVRDIRLKGKFAKLLLSCGYSALKNEEISVSRGLKLLQTRISERNLVDEYVLKAFTPQYKYEQGMQYAYVKYDTDGTIHAENGDIIQDGSIVEFWYDVSDTRPVSYRWRALRVRNDKMRNTVTPTAEVQTKKGSLQIKKIKANDWKTATSIWKSIHEPVSRDMITGVERAPTLVKDAINLQARLLGSDAVYYGRNVSREHLLSVEMLNFHNTVIKDNLYKWPQQIPKNSLLELACGMAGDMNRWQDPVTGFSFRNILGVDLVRDNITKAMDGAYARVLKPRYGAVRKQHQNFVFIIGDCAKTLSNGNAAKGIDKDSEDVLMELYGKTSSRRMLTIIPPFAKDRFDMVSCQFAIHYFFETEEKLKGFMTNVRDNLRPGGIFIATFMDGNSVEKLIREKGKNGLVEGRKLDGKVVVWAIRRILQGAENSGENPQEEAVHQAEEEDAIENLEIERNPGEMDGGAGGRRITKLKAYDPKTNILKELQLINVPGIGDCMFISLEIAAFGKERSTTNDGMWMRTKIVDQMLEILSKDDDEAKSLYDDLKMNIDNITPDVKKEASEMVGKELYSSGEEEDKKDYQSKLSGYLSWMSKKGIWGTQVELRIAAEFLKRPVYIYQTDLETKKVRAYTIGEELYQNKQPVMVWYNGIDHYKALINLEDTNNSKPEIPSTAPITQTAPITNKSFASALSASAPIKKETSRFGRLIDVYLENTNRLIPEYLVDFNLLYEYATQYGLELVHDGMFSDTYQAFKDKNPNAFPGFDKDPVQQQFSFLNRWVVFRRKA